MGAIVIYPARQTRTTKLLRSIPGIVILIALDAEGIT